jgi:surfactin family lipopeptide synthetase A
MFDTLLTEQKRQQLLKAYLQARPQSTGSGPSPIGRRSPGTLAQLSLTQEELWRRETQVPEIAPLYNECVMLRMIGPLDLVALERSLSEVIRRHEIWRTSFETRAGQPVQIVQPAAPLHLRVVDLREFPEADREAQAILLVSQDTRRRFALQSEPLLRPTLVRMGEEEYRLFLVAHLLLLDGISAYQVFPFELAVLYQAYAAGRGSPLPELPIQYGDFACWQREDGQAVFPSQIAYWRKQLEGLLPTAERPSGKPQAPRRTYRGAVRPFAFPRQLSETLRAFAKQENSTLFFVLLAGLATLMRRRTDREQIILGTLASMGRNESDVVNLLGYFLNPVALRLDFQGDPTFHDLLAQSRMVLSNAMLNADVPIEVLARELKHEQNPGPSPFFSTAISLQPPMPSLDLNWSVTTMDVDSGGSPWDLYLAFVDRGHQIMGRVQFDTDLFDLEEISKTVADLQALLRELTLNPWQRVSEVRLS